MMTPPRQSELMGAILEYSARQRAECGSGPETKKAWQRVTEIVGMIEQDAKRGCLEEMRKRGAKV